MRPLGHRAPFPSFIRHASWCSPDYSLADGENFITQCEADWQDGTAFNYAIFDANTSEFCGGIGLNQPNRTHGFYNLGYWVHPSRQRQGLARRPPDTLPKPPLLTYRGSTVLEILTVPENLASQQTALAAGATREGLLRQRLLVGATWYDAILFSLVRADFS